MSKKLIFSHIQHSTFAVEELHLLQTFYHCYCKKSTMPFQSHTL